MSPPPGSLSPPQGSRSCVVGSPSPLWECLSLCWESHPQPRNPARAEPDQCLPPEPTPHHQCLRDIPQLPPSLPIRYLLGPSPRGLCCPWGQQGWQLGPLVGAQPPTLPSVLLGGPPGWGSPGQGSSHRAFPTGMPPPGSPCPQGGCYPHTPHPPTPAEMKDGPGPPGIPQRPPSVCNWGVWCELPPPNPHLVVPSVW